MVKKEKRPLTLEEIGQKIRHFCAYQERSRLQVVRKLKTLGCGEVDIPAILDELAAGNYFNENRFIEQFVRSRSVTKGWGPKKISQALHRETGGNHRDEILNDAESGERALQKLEKDLQRKKEELLRKKDQMIREKLVFFCLQRGFDAEVSYPLVSKVLKN